MSADEATIRIGSTVRVQDGPDKDEYQIVVPAEADPGQGLISFDSPMGRALIGRKVGDEVTVRRPIRNEQVVIIGHIPS